MTHAYTSGPVRIAAVVAGVLASAPALGSAQPGEQPGMSRLEDSQPAQPEPAPPAAGAPAQPGSDHVEWHLEIIHDRGLFDRGGVEPDGRHVGISWQREPSQVTGVLVLRRALPVGTELAGRSVQTIDRPGPVLIPTFLYPTTPRIYHPAFDARSHAIPVGAHVGEWTVVASVDRDPSEPIIDEVERGTPYVYALVPATPAADPDTYAMFGRAVVTPTITAEDAWFYRRRWFHVLAFALALCAVIAGLARIVARVVRSKRNVAGV